MKVQNFISRILSLKMWDGVSQVMLLTDLDYSEIRQALTVLNNDNGGPYILIEYEKGYVTICYDSSWVTE